MKTFLLFFLIFTSGLSFTQPKPVYLWKEIEGMQKEKTRLYIYQAPPSIYTGVSIIICPGGSYHHLGIPHEGHAIAEWLNSQGISAYVLRYRVGMHGYNHPSMIEDLQRAIQYVRENIPTIKTLGLMGFSAGGHLVTMGGTFYKENYLQKLGIKTDTPLRPDFIVAVYPVVSMQDSLAHIRSRKNLLGKTFIKTDIDNFSLELHIPDDMPPFFLSTAKDDPVVNYKNSLVLHQALTNKNIPHTFLLHEKGGHGYGIDEKKGGEAARWHLAFIKWLKENKFIK
ncbi:MAG: alpha/beta hydrolase [Bacteroidales bacterium]|jgi:acetyl esterase/lipase|nr:alpha/beta hydrolase [Bacteroidales bacterium]MDD2687909.1 alpha/beta hydrolase [Bacteroidales bacterium]MDD3330373.1 alpha/beta hydrolase [Bacteroidales bacterium]MDD3691561.1 alpha/beta hydrolase [Bacteroidales bacterium]MDD4045244.1 alpha/beta hydrolase [Bacteroidales bacterium]